MTKELEADIFCRGCRTMYAQLFRVEIREGIYSHVTEPADVPERCTRCQTILERKPR